MTLRIFEKGFNYSQDGPGNRLVYHLQGCNMHCPWCSNPDGIAMAGALVVSAPQLLESACPHGAIRDQKLDRTLCAGCKERPCLRDNPAGIRLSYKECSVDALVREALASRPLFVDGGGVTFTGGECTCQFAPLQAALAALRDRGIHTAIETNGTHPRLPELSPLPDVIMIDLKHWDDATLQRVTGAGLAVTARNIAALLGRGVPLQIRIPLIGGFNDSDPDLAGFLDFFCALALGDSTVELLPYHEYGRDKWAACGMDYTMTDGPIAPETVQRFRDSFLRQGIRVIRT